jgi:hypothetical protein
MDEMQHVEITSIERGKYRCYKVLAPGDRTSGLNILDSHLFTPGELLGLAAWVEQNRTRLTQEAQEDEERDARAWSQDMADQDMADMEQIKQEWREYRLEGDETPPTPPHSL